MTHPLLFLTSGLATMCLLVLPRSTGQWSSKGVSSPSPASLSGGIFCSVGHWLFGRLPEIPVVDRIVKPEDPKESSLAGVNECLNFLHCILSWKWVCMLRSWPDVDSSLSVSLSIRLHPLNPHPLPPLSFKNFYLPYFMYSFIFGWHTHPTLLPCLPLVKRNGLVQPVMSGAADHWFWVWIIQGS